MCIRDRTTKYSMSSDSVSENAKYEVADSCSADKINADDRHHMIMSDVLPDLGKPFYKVPYLRTLSLFVVGLSLSSTNLGYDGSLLNGLYAMPDYLNAMGNPNGAESVSYTHLDVYKRQRK